MGNQACSFRDQFIPFEQMRKEKKIVYFAHVKYFKSGNQSNSLLAKPAQFLFMKLLQRCDQLNDESTVSARQQLLQDVLHVLKNQSRLILEVNPSKEEKRNVVECGASQIKQLFEPECWSIEVLSWLHKTALAKMNYSTRVYYIDVLKTLNQQFPIVVYRVLSHAETKLGCSVIPDVRSCDLESSKVLNENALLPKEALMLVCIDNREFKHDQVRRHLLWNNILSSMLQVFLIDESVTSEFKATAAESTQLLMKRTLNKILELKRTFPKQPLYIIGWSVGALIACHMALKDLVDGVICIGLPLTGVDGFRGCLDNSLQKNKVPTLFIVGEYAQMCTPDDVEIFRLGMTAETSMIVVGGSDDSLRMCSSSQNIEHVTQIIVDRCIMNEIRKFLTYLMNQSLVNSTGFGGKKHSKGEAKQGRRNGKHSCGV